MYKTDKISLFLWYEMSNGQNSKSKIKPFTRAVHLEMKIMLK